VQVQVGRRFTQGCNRGEDGEQGTLQVIVWASALHCNVQAAAQGRDLRYR
jgi:hypothetical protein